MNKEWEEEGNYYEYDIEDMKCLILRNSIMGHLCGYVGLQQYHPLYGKKYNQECSFLKDIINKKYSDTSYPYSPTPERVFTVHGSLTYSNNGVWFSESKEEEPRHLYKEYWFFGFDCMHFSDYTPYMEVLSFYATYRNVEYVKSHIIVLAGQLAEILKQYGGHKIDNSERSDLM